MNKQELIKIYKERKNRNQSANLEVAASRRDLFDNIISDLESLEEPVKKDYFKELMIENAKNGELQRQIEEMKDHEPQKVKVKQFVADWYEEHKGDLEFSIWKLTIESNDNYTSDRSKMRNWIQYAPNKPYETLLSMKNGYEVEEESKWIVKVGNLYFCGWEDTTAQFVMNTVLGEDESIIKYKNERTASSVAKNLGGTVEQVEV